MMKTKFRPMRGLKIEWTAGVLINRATCIHNLRRGHGGVVIETAPAKR
jgi:hypothetical protein